MRTILVVYLSVCFSIGFISCDKLMPVDYDKAGRDLMAMMGSNKSLTISEYKNTLEKSGMSSKDFFTLLKTDPKERASMSQFIQILSMDMAAERLKELNVDVKNLKRALGE
jgi:hypothetical protein